MFHGLAEPTKRSIWSGTISIGLVNVPVRLYPLIKDKSFSFRMLRKDDGCPLKYQRICSYDNKVVPWSDVVRGFEVRKNEFVTFTKEELDALRPESSKKIKIEKFVDLDEVDYIYLDKDYILAPDNSADSYGLLLEALRQKRRAGVGKFTLRTKEYTVLIHEHSAILILTTLRYATEIVDTKLMEEIIEYQKPNEKELDLAAQIIEGFSSDFNITDYEDGFQERVKEMVQSKLEGETIILAEKPEEEEVKDLMLALQETLEQLKT
jgi:DNA end-binding protein Ku